MTDRDRVYALLRSLLDWVPGPRGSRTYALPGFVAPQPARCPDCEDNGFLHGDGRVRDRLGVSGCATCLGRGHTGAHEAPDPYDKLAGVKLPAPDAKIATRAAWRKRSDARKARDAELERLEGMSRVRAGFVDSGEREPWEPARDRLYASGSYAELERALQQLRERAPYHHEIVWLYAVCGLEDTVRLGPRARGKIDGIVDRLVVWMPSVIRLPPWLEGDDEEGLRKHALWHGRSNGHDERRLRRNRLIRDLDTEGVTVTEISRRTGLGRQHVHELLAGDAHYQAGGTAA